MDAAVRAPQNHDSLGHFAVVVAASSHQRGICQCGRVVDECVRMKTGGPDSSEEHSQGSQNERQSYNKYRTTEMDLGYSCRRSQTRRCCFDDGDAVLYLAAGKASRCPACEGPKLGPLRPIRNAKVRMAASKTVGCAYEKLKRSWVVDSVSTCFTTLNDDRTWPEHT